jgi:hypothetical protein
VIAHRVRLASGTDELGALRRPAFDGAGIVGLDQLANEPVHFPAVHVALGGLLVVRAAHLALTGGVIRPDASTEDRIGSAHGGVSVAHGDPIGPRIGPEVVIERTVLLDDEDEVPKVAPGELQLGAGWGR